MGSNILTASKLLKSARDLLKLVIPTS